ncbi:Serpentine receptor class gamma-16 [Caenorhabditis elegans]|uniref:Serpentine receptor class gamma-16 n=1 Tax=Caenorhabditis elegans TaxID=6239 RepID=SRG16_CAEEL|nr:Serpentine receptor class gamma-16 [Caenorhabditis elegans]O17819.2 RecName: Full=Serpentine receptor class gamma-16; Short=Protein srg-16 [Caenorhabditis elegans]CAB02948.2 Serpentine receptor class gamma-16 [Caenorhabditis elegans]|eukprot:NP_496656.2 Serpentine receptor class gamma-16 [Caenorhabditis elegans]
MNTSIRINCSKSYDDFVEASKFVGFCLYLIPGAILHVLILRILLIKQRKVFRNNSFFRIFATDSVVSLVLIFWGIFFNRLFMFIPPLCPLVSPLFFEPSLFLKMYYWMYNHARMSKSVAQILMVLNRMCCVISPIGYEKIWNKLAVTTVFVVLALPFFGSWNLLLSRMYIFPSYGGFNASYVKYVQWASLSMFQSIFLLIALCFTIICSSVSLYKLIILPDRIKSAEKSLCFVSLFYSIAFLVVAVSQLIFVFCEVCLKNRLYLLFQFFAFDFLTVGSAVIIMLSSPQLSNFLGFSGTFYRRKASPPGSTVVKIFTSVHNNSSII